MRRGNPFLVVLEKVTRVRRGAGNLLVVYSKQRQSTTGNIPPCLFESASIGGSPPRGIESKGTRRGGSLWRRDEDTRLSLGWVGGRGGEQEMCRGGVNPPQQVTCTSCVRNSIRILKNSGRTFDAHSLCSLDPHSRSRFVFEVVVANKTKR